MNDEVKADEKLTATEDGTIDGTITVKAYAIQYSGFEDDPQSAWNAVTDAEIAA